MKTPSYSIGAIAFLLFAAVLIGCASNKSTTPKGYVDKVTTNGGVIVTIRSKL